MAGGLRAATTAAR